MKKQPILTLADIEDDPWTAVNYDLPDHPSAELLDRARHAASACAQEQYDKMVAAREGSLTPPGYRGTPDAIEPDVHEYYEQDWLNALDRLDLIESTLYRGTPAR